MKHPVNVVMLPTEDSSNVRIMNYIGTEKHDFEKIYNSIPTLATDKIFSSKNNRHSAGQFMHLYITVSQDVEPSKKGDWIVHPHYGLRKVVGNDESIKALDNIEYTVKNIDLCTVDAANAYGEKIIATTDPKLYRQKVYRASRKRETLYQDSKGTYEWINIMPRVQQSFLEEFVTTPEGKWEVEYELFSAHTGLKLKINQDHTVNINSVTIMPVHIHEGVSNINVQIEDGVIHIRANKKKNIG